MRTWNGPIRSGRSVRSWPRRRRGSGTFGSVTAARSAARWPTPIPPASCPAPCRRGGRRSRRGGRPGGVRCGGAGAVRARVGGVPPRGSRGVRGAGGGGGGGEGAPVRARTVRLSLNGRDVEALTPPHRTLLEVLREDLGATEVM